MNVGTGGRTGDSEIVASTNAAALYYKTTRVHDTMLISQCSYKGTIVGTICTLNKQMYYTLTQELHLYVLWWQTSDIATIFKSTCVYIRRVVHIIVPYVGR